MPAILGRWVDRFLMPVDDPGSRLFHFNLIVALAMILIWLMVRRNSLRGSAALLRRLVWSKSYWWNSSTQVDYKIYFLNSLFKVLLFIPFLDFSFRISRFTVKILVLNTGEFGGLHGAPIQLMVFSIAAFVFDDFLRFGHHYLMHKIPLLWRLHQLHHSATILTPLTLYRIHPLESAISTVRNSLSLGVATGVFIYIFESQLNVFTLFGVNALGFMFNLLGANLRHSHIPVSFGRLETIFISPKQHQIHHSAAPEHFDKNFGVSLSLWDKLSGSLIRSNAVGTLHFGIDEHRGYTLSQHLLNPFRLEAQHPQISTSQARALGN